MSHELICSWLGLPANGWPPDHYRLLGLEPGEGDLALIERQVHLRLDSIRPYQMMHPEPATEVMNRLAQAFVCLTEASAKKDYDEHLLGKRASPESVPLPSLPLPASPSEPRHRFAWLGKLLGHGGPTKPAPEPAVPVAPVVSVPVVEVPLVDPLRAAAQSPPARRGLGTRHKLYRRVLATRHLQRLWHRMGKYLADPQRRLSTHDARELYRLIEQLEAAADEFPLLGDLGQPGHYILNLGQFDRSRNLCGLTRGQRDLLQTDWKAGLTFLEGHRDFLRDEMTAFRRRGRFDRFRHALNATFRDRPMVATLLLGGIVALAVAAGKTLAVAAVKYLN